MAIPLPDSALAQLFSSARTHHHWLPQAVPDQLLLSVYEQLKYGPTSANSCPARLVFVKSAAAKARLLPCLSSSNIEQTLAAPVTVIVAHDAWQKPRQFSPKLWCEKPNPKPQTTEDRKSTRLNSSHPSISRMPSSA